MGRPRPPGCPCSGPTGAATVWRAPSWPSANTRARRVLPSPGGISQPTGCQVKKRFLRCTRGLSALCHLRSASVVTAKPGSLPLYGGLIVSHISNCTGRAPATAALWLIQGHSEGWPWASPYSQPRDQGLSGLALSCPPVSPFSSAPPSLQPGKIHCQEAEGQRHRLSRAVADSPADNSYYPVNFVCTRRQSLSTSPPEPAVPCPPPAVQACVSVAEEAPAQGLGTRWIS